MVSSVIDKAKIIANALARFSITLNVDLEGDDPRTQRLSSVYDDTKNWVFSLHHWSFLQHTAKCDLIDKVSSGLEEGQNWPNGYAYCHQLPGNLIGTFTKLLSASQPGANIRNFAREQKRIYSNSKNLWVTGTFDLNEDKWPSGFVSVFTGLLAGNFAVPEVHDFDLEHKFLTETLGTPQEHALPGGKMGRLIAQDLAEDPPDSPLRSGDPLTNAHNSGAWYGRF